MSCSVSRFGHQEVPPWDEASLPEHLRGYGYRGADQDGFTGSEWVSPMEHWEAERMEELRVELDIGANVS
jgi:hypothetical protein